MKTKNTELLFAVALLAGAMTASLAAQGRGRGGPPNYSVAAETTVKGTVEDLKPGPNQAMHLTLKTSDATLELALGPPWYQTEKKYVIAKGDQIDVVGAKNTLEGRDVLLVREIKKGSETMTFRNASGLPLWSGRGGGSTLDSGVVQPSAPRQMMPGMGRGMMNGMEPGMMMGSHDAATRAQMADIHALFMSHERITRTVTNLPDGIRTVTESADPRIAQLLKDHVTQMGERVATGDDPGLPMESPALRLLYRNHAKIHTTSEPTSTGIAVVQTSSDAETVAALQQHASEVTDFVTDGMAAMHAAMMKRGGMTMPKGK